jgi:hypothetical protein
MCTRCKHHAPSAGYKMCDQCRSKMRSQYHRLRKEPERERFARMSELKANTPCADCGSYKDARDMQWDHRPGEVKLGNVSDLIAHGHESEAMVEVGKCDLVCASCHGLRSVSRGQIWSGPQTTGICETCGTEFKYRASAKRRFCSRSCSSKRKGRWNKH